MESPIGTLLKTPLHSAHRSLGAKMITFGAWEMPVEYSGLIAEHLAVRQAAGLFDVSHMGEFIVEGAGALAFLQRVTCNNVAKLVDGQAHYTALPLDNGAPADDVILYRRSGENFVLIVNAGNREKDLAWLRSQHPTDCRLDDRSDDYALMALQGPNAQAILASLTAADLPSLAYYHFTDATVAGVAATIARTGYTGEDGFELLVPPQSAEDVWMKLLDAGKPRGLVPAGLGARDTLRLEAKMCLYGNDIDETTSLIEAGLGWTVSLEEAKGAFPGRTVLEGHKKNGPPRKLVGFEVTGRGIARHGYPVLHRGEVIGQVTSGSYAPFLQKSIGLCYLPSAIASTGTEIDVDIRGRRVEARVVPTPFYKRPR